MRSRKQRGGLDEHGEDVNDFVSPAAGKQGNHAAVRGQLEPLQKALACEPGLHLVNKRMPQKQGVLSLIHI